MQRRRESGRHSRGSSAVENGSGPLAAAGLLCPGGVACSSSSSSGGGFSCSCMRKSSSVRRLVNTLRVRLRQAVGSSKSQKSLVWLAAYLVGCSLVFWCGLRISTLGGGVSAGGEERRPAQRQLMDGVGVDGASVKTVPTSRSGHRVEGDVGPRLAYGIMVYQRQGYSPQKTLDQFARMFNALYDKDNTYVIHVDVKSDKALLDAISYHIKDLPNAFEVPSVSVSWGGVTVVERTLALMTKAVEVDSSWRFFVNLGHEDYPSASQAEMRGWLKDKEDGTNFIKCWPIEGHDFFGQMERHEQRVQDVNVDDFMGGVREYRSLSGRPGSQERPKSGYRFYKSLQQTMLSRQLTEYAIFSSEARRLLLYMATAKAPDELYFPTLTQLDDRFSSMATCNDTRHFSYWIRPGGSWHPEYLTLDHLPIILDATEFYIRKVEESRGSKPLLDVLDLLRAGHPIEDTLFILTAWLNRKAEDGVTLAAEGGPIMEFPEDGTAEEALAELFRRQSEDAEAKRCLFLGGLQRRSRKRAEASKSAAALAAAQTSESRGSKHSFGRKRKPFAHPPGAAHRDATGGRKPEPEPAGQSASAKGAEPKGKVEGNSDRTTTANVATA